ncbi:MAG: chorismate synthase [Acidobacteriota bacterium]
MNSFGKCFQINIFGESHGSRVGIVVDGVPAGLPLNPKDFVPDLEKRKPGASGTTPRLESDKPFLMSGILNGRATGAPILIAFQNQKAHPKDYEPFRELPRPGHADWVALQKYGRFNDSRGGGHFSGRLTVGLVAAGVIAKKMIHPIKVKAKLLEVGGCKNISKTIQRVSRENDSIGGLVECRVHNLFPGLGEPFFDSVESLISHIVFSVPGIKGIEFGSGFACSKMRGSDCNDIITNKQGKTSSNHSGGINGGITNGNELVYRTAVRPTSSIPRPQKTVNIRTGNQETLTIKGRHDTCIALRMPVIVEASTAIVLTDLMLQTQKIQRIWEPK